MKIKPIPVLIGVCVLLAGVAVFSLIRSSEVDPERYITLADYKNVNVTVLVEDADDEEIENALQSVLIAMGKTQVTDASAVIGDKVYFSYTGKIGGKVSNDFSGSCEGIVLGQDEFLVKGMDPFLVGKKTGETVNATLTVQENYHIPEYAGKTVDFSVKVTKVEHTTVPELTDELAAKMGNYKTAEEFKTAFREKYIAERKAENKASVRSELWSKVVEDSKAETYPQKDIDALKAELDQKVTDFAKESETEFINAASFLYGVSDMKEYKTYADNYAKRVEKQRLVLKAICNRENLVITDEVYKKWVQRYLDTYADQGYTEEKLLETFGGEEGLKEQFLMEMATDIIQRTATVTYA